MTLTYVRHDIKIVSKLMEEKSADPPPSVSWELAGEQLEKFALKLRSFAYNVRVLANMGRLEVQQWQ